MKLITLYRSHIEKKILFRIFLFSRDKSKNQSERLKTAHRVNIKCFFVVPLLFILFFATASEIPFSGKEEVLLESEELKVRKVFPLYKVNFNHKAVQEKVYNDFINEQEEKEKSDKTVKPIKK